MNRHQATEIPHLLVAPKVQIGPQLPTELETAHGDETAPNEADDDADYDYNERPMYADDQGQSKSYYEDGAFFDLGEDDFEEGEEREDGIDPSTAMQEAYFASLMRSYLILRDILNRPPPKDASNRLSSSHLTHAAPFGRSSHTTSVWTNVLTTLDPHPLQLALLSKDSIFLILRVLLGGQLLHRGREIPERISRWLWALLARLPEPGELTHWELGCVRDLGKRAVLLGTSMEEMEALREEVEEDGLGITESQEDDADEQLLAEGAPSSKTKESNPTNGSEPSPEEGASDEEPAEDIAMELDSSGDEDDAPAPQSLEEARRRLLAQLEEDSDTGDPAIVEATRRREMNMRATISMILTVTGEFYGQRDLLEFRDPFASSSSTS